MCLVEVEKMPKLQIACNTKVAEGMVVHTCNDRVKRAQAAVLEFLLINHPIDCPVCDQAGECKLQDYYMDYDHQPSRFPLGRKNHKGKAIDIGSGVMLDQERCILCARCTRFFDEVTRTSELAIFGRGDHDVIDTYPGRKVDNKYAGNIVDICPVGALTEKDFRFRMRVWYLHRTPSICGGCERGCSIDIHHHRGGFTASSRATTLKSTAIGCVMRGGTAFPRCKAKRACSRRWCNPAIERRWSLRDGTRRFGAQPRRSQSQSSATAPDRSAL
jgi:NADH-quinone oxidoreductase subunit G